MDKKTARKRDIGSIVENAKNDKNSGSGVGRGNKLERTREAFRAWLMLPNTHLGAPEHVLRALGIIDPESIELFGIRSQSEFGAKFDVAEPTLSRWKKEMRDDTDFRSFRAHMQGLTKNVMGAFYRKALEEGDAARVKLWLAAVEGWYEGARYEPVESGLSDEEKKALDRMIEKNCR